MSAVSAMEAVFSTYELVEHTFIKLTIRQLFKNQRVNTTWRAVILRSQSLRRRMWLAPTGAPLNPVVKDMKPWAPEYVQRFRPNICVKVDYSPRKRHCKHGHRGAYRAVAIYKFASLSFETRKFMLYGPLKPSPATTTCSSLGLQSLRSTYSMKACREPLDRNGKSTQLGTQAASRWEMFARLLTL